MNLRDSFYYRFKTLAEQVEANRSIREGGLDKESLKGIPFEFISILETVKNYYVKANVLLDIGTHEGLFARSANVFFNFDKTVCFEPNTDFNKSILENGKGLDLIVENIALSDKSGEALFYNHFDNSMSSILASDSRILNSEFSAKKPSLIRESIVNTVTLDEYIAGKFRKEKFFIKIDTQGSEFAILQKGTKTLEQTEICLIEFMFTSPYSSGVSFSELISFMERNNFECKGPLTIAKRPSKKVSVVDFLFVNRAVL